MNKIVREHLRFNIDIVSHCNLNCKGCGHFSPLSKENFISLESLRNDCKRLSELSNGKVERIDIMGGEPLLHPDIIEILCICRDYFIGEINVCTNGLLLPSMSDKFYSTCASKDINIAVTIYPIKLDWEAIDKKAAFNHATIKKIGTKGYDHRLWYKNKRDLTGSQDKDQNFEICPWGNNCIILEEGHMSTCVMPLKSRSYNEYYQKEVFKVSPQDYIDIYQVKSLEELMQFFSHSIPFCRYCLPNNSELIEWGVSSKDIDEWS